MTLYGALSMTNSAYRTALGKRIKELRKGQKLTQKELATQLGISFGQLNKYESALNSPSAELLVSIADKLKVSLDYLLTGLQAENAPFLDVRLLDRLSILQKLEPRDQETIMEIIDAMIVKHKASELLIPVSRKKAS